MSATAVDVLGSGHYVSFVAQGWLWLPENSLTGREASEDIFINIPVYNGLRIISWVEL